MSQDFLHYLANEIESLKQQGLYKGERVITSHQKAAITNHDGRYGNVGLPKLSSAIVQTNTNPVFYAVIQPFNPPIVSDTPCLRPRTC